MPHQDAQVRNMNILGVGRRDGPERRVLEGERGPANDPQTVDKLCLDEFGATGHLTEARVVMWRVVAFGAIVPPRWESRL